MRAEAPVFFYTPASDNEKKQESTGGAEHLNFLFCLWIIWPGWEIIISDCMHGNRQWAKTPELHGRFAIS